MAKDKKSMEDKLKEAGWRKTLEGWVDPDKGDKVSKGAAWVRYLKKYGKG